MKQLAWQSAAVATHEAEKVDVFIDLGGVQTGVASEWLIVSAVWYWAIAQLSDILKH